MSKPKTTQIFIVTGVIQEFYSKWIACGQRPLTGRGSGFLNDGVSHCVRSSAVDLLRSYPDMFCTLVEAEREKYSADPCSKVLSQFEDLKRLYENLYSASGGNSKIYVLGYPQFINNNKKASCKPNVGVLDYEERQVIYQGTSYLNNVIEQAAKAAGVKYLYIENSLEGHRLCDSGAQYMTGIAGIGGYKGNDLQESFHPNAKGHFEMAMTVWDRVDNESLLNHYFCGNGHNSCPDSSVTKNSVVVPEYFEAVQEKRSLFKKVMNFLALKGSPAKIMTGSYAFKPLSSANITMYSEPTNLGDYQVNEEGSLEENIIIPNTLPAGYHTLVITGESYSGEPIELEQIVLVTGPDPKDQDENGVPDSQQPCGPFLNASNIDEDKDGIDDACDPLIETIVRLPDGDNHVTSDTDTQNKNFGSSTSKKQVLTVVHENRSTDLADKEYVSSVAEEAVIDDDVLNPKSSDPHITGKVPTLGLRQFPALITIGFLLVFLLIMFCIMLHRKKLKKNVSKGDYE